MAESLESDQPELPRGPTSTDAMLARTSTMHRSVGPIAYDCVKVIIVRDGSAILFSGFGQQPAKVGDVILLSANTLCGSKPEGHITVTTVYLDTDYVIDQVFWQYAGLLADRLDALGFAEAMYTEPAQILRLGEDRAGMLMPWLDELVALSLDGGFIRHFYRMQALWFSIAHVIGRSSKSPRYGCLRRNARPRARPNHDTADSRHCGRRHAAPRSCCAPILCAIGR